MIVITRQAAESFAAGGDPLPGLRNTQKMKAGADAIVLPDFTGGMRIASAMIGHVVGFLDEMLKSEKRLRVEEVPVPVDFPETPLETASAQPGIRAAGGAQGARLDLQSARDYVLRHGQTLITMSAPPVGRNWSCRCSNSAAQAELGLTTSAASCG